MQKHFHKLAMGSIFAGGLVALSISFMWFRQGNPVMGIGMFFMGIVAFANFYLHGRAMRKSNEK